MKRRRRGGRPPPGPWCRAGALAAALVLSGCGTLERGPVPDPYAPAPAYGRVVREIRVEGNRQTDAGVIRAALASRVGAPYTAHAATRDYNRLLQLHVFHAIRFSAAPVEDGIALTVHVEERGSYLPTVSLGHTHENGLEIGPGIGAPNLFGRASRASAYTRFGGARNAGFVFQDRWRSTERWFQCCLEAKYFHRNRPSEVDDFQERSNEISLQFLANVTEQFHLGPRLSYLSIQERPDPDSALRGVTLDPDGRDEIPGVGIVAEVDARNFALYPTHGWYASLSGERFGGPLGGPADYRRMELDLRRYLELSGPEHSLAAYSLLTLTRGEPGRDLPIHQDFHLGGANTVRGWPLGSREGKNQWIGTVEYWWRLAPRSSWRFLFVRWSMWVQLAAFADVGTAWNHADEFHDNWIGGGGIGARLVIPEFGFLRFDVALGRDAPGLGVSFHYGNGERAETQKRRVR